MIQPREYQLQHINDIIRKLSTNRKVCAQLATGGGKTVEFSLISKRFIDKFKKSVLILVHRKELLEQTRKTIADMHGINATLIVAGMAYIPHAEVYIGMVESVVNRISRMREVGLVIVDECHIATFNKVYELFPNEFVIGFTATPKSSNKNQPINRYYNDISVCPVDIKQLIKLGYLAQNITRCPKDIVDKTKIRLVAGEYDSFQMGEEFGQQKYVDNCCIAYARWGYGKKTMVYNVNVEHSLLVTKAFNICGVPCRHVDADSPDRAEIFKWFKETENAVLCNVGIATVGYDEPTIEQIIVNRLTKSMPLWMQMCGRGGRRIDEVFISTKQKEYPYKLKEKYLFNIIDMGANSIEHGDWSDERDWTYIFNNPDTVKTGVAPVKTCPKCEGLVHAATITCKLPLENGEICGYIFDRRKAEEEKELEEFVTITEDIDIEKIIKQRDEKNYKKYFVMYQMGRDIVDKIYEKGKQLTDKQVDIVYKQYFELVEKWHKENYPKEQFLRDWHLWETRNHFMNTLKTKFSKTA